MIVNKSQKIQPVSVIFEDRDLMVIEKPANLIVNSADTTSHVQTVQDWAEDKLKFELKSVKIGDETDFLKRGGIVHRLDKETSGLLIIAKKEDCFLSLQKQFKEGLVEKEYIALLHGKLLPEEGVIDAPIGRLPWNRTRFGVFPGGRESKTLYKVESYFQNRQQGNEVLTLVRLYPKTGRTHQIRVHMQYITHPLFSDALYAGRKIGIRDRKQLPRHFLHAQHISFDHPKTHARLSLQSYMPADLSQLLSSLAPLSQPKHIEPPKRK